MSILVTGATGKTGAPIVAELERRGAPYRAGVRRPDGSPEQVRFDWDEPGSWGAAAEGIETVYLVKPPIDPVPPVRAFLDAAPWVSRVVLLSELGRERKPETDPERAVELLVESRNATILRPNWFHDNVGPGGGWGEAIRRAGEIRLPTGDAALGWVDVRDVVDIAVIALLGEDLGGVDVNGPELLTVAELAAGIAEVSGRAVKHDAPSLAEYRAELERAGTDPLRVAYLMDLVTDAATGEYGRTSNDVERLLGRPPRPLDDYLAEHADYWR
ncbi:MAG: hypothetical protein J7518_16435 [Nocardioidaceae bacterium]|nr:hypothetical protein [Nocardioidaceae bacterium]